MPELYQLQVQHLEVVKMARPYPLQTIIFQQIRLLPHVVVGLFPFLYRGSDRQIMFLKL